MIAHKPPITGNLDRCPTCGEIIPPALIGRPRKYCDADCRREMYARIRELADLEAQLAQARILEKDWGRVSAQYGDRHRREIAWLEPKVEQARARIPEELQP